MSRLPDTGRFNGKCAMRRETSGEAYKPGGRQSSRTLTPITDSSSAQDGGTVCGFANLQKRSRRFAVIVLNSSIATPSVLGSTFRLLDRQAVITYSC